MDAVELARQIAADLHRQAVMKGHNPWRPYEFALAEAHRRGLDVEPTAAGSLILDGGRATVIAVDSLILHENIGTVFEQAFLVAHEIGHIELGDGVINEPSRDVELARSAEPSPVGIDRVVDYGRGQRREIQMDLFAREFLLPRVLVRKLHVEDGMTATEIAAKIGAPFDLVAQQLFDALLLPETVIAVDAKTVEHPLNTLQTSASSHRGKAFLLEAGPGTGKTQTLIARVEGLLAEGIDPRRILLLTFSNKAANEMAERIGRKNKVAAVAMWIGTFHAFGLDIIRRFHIELGLPKDPRMMDRAEAVELLEAEFPRLDLNHYRNLYDPSQIIADMLTAISRAKDEVINEVQYTKMAKDMLESAATKDESDAAERAIEVARVYSTYEELKRQANCVDFGDLVSIPVRLLEENLNIREHLQTQYDHVLVDEYQDVNRSSVRLLMALRSDGQNLWAVGDAKQSIYRFRGASSLNMTQFGTSDFAGGVRGRLKRNYRSVDEIVQTFSTFAINMMAGDQDSGLESERGRCGASPQLRIVNQSSQQTVAIADAIEEMRQAGHSYRDQVVLCTGNEKLSEIGQDLERIGIPVLFFGSLFERQEIKELLSFLTILTDRRAMGLVRVTCMPEFAMSISDVDAILTYLRATDTTPGSWQNEISKIIDLSESGRIALRAVATTLQGFDQNSEPWTVLAMLLLDRTRIASHIGGSDNVAERTRGLAIWQFMNFLRVQPSGKGPPIVRLLDRVRRLVRLGDDRELRQLPVAAQSLDAVQLMTIHGAKGLEFPVVHVPGLNADTIPRAPQATPCPPPSGMFKGEESQALDAFSASHIEEQECLFYVALSRARDRLFLYAPTRKSNGHSRPLSRFLDKLGAELVIKDFTTIRDLPPNPESSSIELIVDGALRLTAAQIALYERCPRRFFYTHMLQIGGRRTTTAFMQMHEAVRTVLQSLVTEGNIITKEGDLDEQIEKAMAKHGLADHGYISEFKMYATSMIQYFLAVRKDHVMEKPTALSVTLGDDEIIVRPDEVLMRPDGSRILRRVQTGHFRTVEMDDTSSAAFVLAAQVTFPCVTAEIVHLSDKTITPLELTPKKLENRMKKIKELLGQIRASSFPAATSTRMCPGCPAFFLCGRTPAGTLRKNIS